MKKRMILTLLAVVTMTSLLFVGCGGKETVAVNSTETEIETNVAEAETSIQEESEEVIAETEIQTEEPTQTKEAAAEAEPTSAPTETTTPTPEPVHEHSYSVTVIKEATCTGKIVFGGLSEAEASGEKLYSCSCGHSYTETISPIYCESDGNFVTIRAATCGMEGEIADHCKHCGREMVYKATPMTEHVPTIRVDVPEDGKWFIPCEYCGTTIEWGYLE